MSNEFKVCSNVDCEQKQPIHISGFSKNRHAPDGLQSWCKECMKKYKKNWLEAEAREAGKRVYKEGLITDEEIEDAVNLFKSCRSRIHSCKYNIGIYKDVECYWDEPYQFLKDILTVREDRPNLLILKDNIFVDGALTTRWNTLWDDWKNQRKIYLASGNKDDKPELDRINGGKSPYKIGNIRCLSQFWNREEAKPVTPLKIKLYKDGQLINERHFVNYEPMKRWIVAETACKVGQKKLHMIDQGMMELSDKFSFEILSFGSMMEEYEQEQQELSY